MVAMGREYWKSCLPARYQALLDAGELEQVLTTAAEMTLEAMQSLRKAGFSEWEAWEATREDYLLLEKEIGSGADAAVRTRKSAVPRSRQVNFVLAEIRERAGRYLSPAKLSPLNMA
jgi:hypothetical protein